MRELRAKFEYLIECPCGSKYMYDKYDLHNGIRCKCGKPYKLDGSHDTYMLEKVRMYEYSGQIDVAKKVIEEDRKVLENLSE